MSEQYDDKTPTRQSRQIDINRKQKKNKKSVKRKNMYLRLFFYSFCGTFIILGTIALIIFINSQDSNIFGFSNRYYEEARQYIMDENYEKAEKSLLKCLDYDNTNSDAILMLCDIYEKQDKIDEALLLLRNSIAEQTQNAKNDALYKKVIQLYTSQNKMSEAFQFLNESDSYIKTRLFKYRPENLTPNPAQGVYDSQISVTFDIQEGCSVYYTLDGSQPTKDSSLYSQDSKIIIDKGLVTLRAFAINENGLISDEVNAQYRVYNDNTPYEFIDSKVEAIVRATLKKDTGVIYYRDLSKITRFSNDVSGINSNSAIKSLDDLLSLVNLSEIYLKNETSVSDFSVLNSVKGLTSLTLNNCGLSSESAKSIYALSSLSSLDLSGNGISDISQISAMTGLRNLNLSENLITDISPLANLINLKSLNLSNNKIYDLNPLSNVTALSELDISDNVTVTNLSGISRLTNIQTLKMSNVTITNLDDLRTFTGLVNLKIDGTLITNLEPLNGITSLSALDVSRTNITDFSVLATTNIKNLVADNMGLTVISSLSEISTLEVLEVIGNTISDVSALAGLPRLKTINLSKNAVANLETLSECKSLTLINCTGMDIPGDTLRLFESLGVTVIAA